MSITIHFVWKFLQNPITIRPHRIHLQLCFSVFFNIHMQWSKDWLLPASRLQEKLFSVRSKQWSSIYLFIVLRGSLTCAGACKIQTKRTNITFKRVFKIFTTIPYYYKWNYCFCLERYLRQELHKNTLFIFTRAQVKLEIKLPIRRKK